MKKIENILNFSVMIMCIGLLVMMSIKLQQINVQLGSDSIELQTGYKNLIHRIWIDNPSYVEDVLNETDEFVYLDSLLNHDWGDTFEFWSKEDKNTYDKKTTNPTSSR